MTSEMTGDMSDDPTDDDLTEDARADDESQRPGAPDWWASVVDHVAAHENDVPDPWADVELSPAVLTADQESFLGGFEDQPAPPHVGDVDPLAAGGVE